MFQKVMCGFVFAAMAVLSAAASYNVTFYDPVVVNGTTLKPGDYRVEIKDNTAIIKQGKVMVQASVKIENNEKKFATSTVRMNAGQLEEIRLGGTHTRVMFETKGTATD